MAELINFSLADVTSCGAAVRRCGVGATSMEEVANRIVHYLYDTLVELSPDSADPHPACALIRCYKTHAYAALPPDLQDFARSAIVDEIPQATTPCLTLLATRGAAPSWNRRQDSVGHQAIPLTSPELIARLPMVAQLMTQFEVGFEQITIRDPIPLIDLQQRTFNVFYVPDAAGSLAVPAQEEFVVPYRIRSVVGFGGLLPSGDLFAIICFARVPIVRSVAALFEPLALSVKLALLPFDRTAVFA